MSDTEVIAHRGFTRTHLENTIAAFRDAIALGVDGIELDVHGSLDGALVVHHDPLIRSPHDPAQPPLRIGECTLQDIRTQGGRDSQVATLDEVLEDVAGRARVYVEIKAPRIEDLVRQAVHTRRDWCAVHSFDHRCMARLRKLDPDIERGVLMSSYLIDPIAPLRDTGARDLWQHHELLDADLVDLVHTAGGRVIAWTVNDESEIRRFVAMGVDGICTDVADAAVALVGRGHP